MKIKSLIFALVAIVVAILLSMYFRESLFFLVGTLKFGWLISNILLRLLVIIFFAVFLHHVLKLILKQRTLKFGWVFLIALLPGFGLSFITPIYNVDFGKFNDDFKLVNKTHIDQYLKQQPDPANYSLYAFFTTTCPHCKEASERLGTNIESGQKIQVNILFPSTEEDAQKFLADHKGSKFNYGLIENDSVFIVTSGGAFPSVFLVDGQGTTVSHWTGDELNYTALDYLKSLE